MDNNESLQTKKYSGSVYYHIMHIFILINKYLLWCGIDYKRINNIKL